MKKQTYISPKLRVTELSFEGIIAASDRIPVDPTPSAPATNQYQGVWSSSQWENTKGE